MKNTGYQQAVIAKKVSRPGNFPLDTEGNLCSDSGRKQAALILEGEENPYPDQYDVEGIFRYGDIIDGYDTRVYNPEACPVDDTSLFEVNKVSLSYPVSKDGLGFDIPDTLLVISSYQNLYKDYTVTSVPSWLKATKGTTSGNTSVLNLLINRNRDSDDERKGVIVLTQADTGNTLQINVMQDGRLTNGIPTEYPYITTENIIDRYYSVYDETSPENNRYREEERPHQVAQIGRQRWLAQDVRVSYDWQEGESDLTQSFQMQENQYNTWLNTFPYARDYDWHTYNSEISGRNFRGLFVQRMVEQGWFDSWQRGFSEGHNHNVPSFADFKEMLGFVVAYFWDGIHSLYDADYIRDLTKGCTLMKIVKDTASDGYDSDRRAYMNGINPELVHHGKDTFGLSFHSNYIFNNQDINNTNQHLSRIMVGITLMISDFIDHGGGPGSETNRGYNRTMEYGKSIPSNWDVPDPSKKNWGWKAGEEVSGYVGKTFRSMRIVELPFKIYTNGSEIIRIKNGEAVSTGYSEVPKGALAGAYFARPEFTYAQWDAVNGFINWHAGDISGNPEAKVEMIG